MISVCIATYNGERYIKEQLLSIIPQLSLGDEIIISDDYSSDHTVDVVKSIASPLVHIIYNDGEQGYTANFENALKHTNGDYIILSDQDDVWAVDKVNIIMSALEVCDFVVSDAIIVDSDLREIATSFYQERLPRKTLMGNIIKFGYIGCCMAFKHKVLEKALPFPSNHVLCTHDNWLFLVAKAFFKVNIVNDKLVYYRRHSQNVSTGSKTNNTSMVFKLRYRAYLICNLMRRAWR